MRSRSTWAGTPCCPRVPATLGNGVYLGGFLCATLPVAAGLALVSTGLRMHLLRLVVALSLAAVVLCGARSAFLALIAAGILHFSTAGKVRPRPALAAAGACAALGIALAVFLSLDAGASLRVRFQQWRDDFYGGPRLLVWRDSLALLPMHPFAGMGPDTFANEFRRRQSSELSRAYPDFHHESPHNFVIDGMAAQGFPFLVFLAGLAYLAWACGPLAQEDPRSWLRASVAATFVSLLFLTSTLAGVMMLFIGFALMVAEPAGPAAAATLYWVQDRALARVSRAAQAGAFEEAAEWYRSAAEMRFPGPSEDLWASRQFAVLARGLQGERASRAWKVAADASARAERTGDNRADAAYQSAMLRLAAGDAVQGERKLRDAIEAAPKWYKPHILLAQLLRYTGRGEEAAQEAGRALEMAGRARPDVEKALREPEAR